MRRSGTCSNVTAAEARRLVAALAANLPPPEDVKPVKPTGTLCAFANDTGEPAFIGLPCRGHRIECRKTGVVTYAANCRDGKCKHYEEDHGS